MDDGWSGSRREYALFPMRQLARSHYGWRRATMHGGKGDFFATGQRIGCLRFQMPTSIT